MAKYWPVEADEALPKVQLPSGVRVQLEYRAYDTEDPADAEVIAFKPGFFETSGVEQATAAPGEKRAAKRKPGRPKKADQ